MEFEFTHQLDSGAEVTVLAEVDVRKEDVSLSLTLPWSSGVHLERIIIEAGVEREDIENRAWERALQLQRDAAEGA